MNTAPEPHLPVVRATYLLRRVEQLLALGFNHDMLAGYLLADSEQGLLKPTSPQWILRSAIFAIEMGMGPELDRIEEVKRLVDRLCRMPPEDFSSVHRAFSRAEGENNRSSNANPA